MCRPKLRVRVNWCRPVTSHLRGAWTCKRACSEQHVSTGLQGVIQPVQYLCCAGWAEAGALVFYKAANRSAINFGTNFTAAERNVGTRLGPDYVCMHTQSGLGGAPTPHRRTLAQWTHTHTHTRMHARTHTCTRTHAHHIHAFAPLSYSNLAFTVGWPLKLTIIVDCKREAGALLLTASAGRQLRRGWLGY